MADAGKHSETLENQSLGLANARTNGQLTFLVQAALPGSAGLLSHRKSIGD